MSANDTAESIAQEFKEFSSYSMTPKQAHELIERARSKCPVPHSEQLGGFHVLMNYDDVRLGLLDWKTFGSSPSVLRPYIEGTPVFPPNSYDPPEHKPWRKVFTDGVNVRTAERIEPDVREDTIKLIDAFIEDGRCDLHLQLAEHVPMQAIFHVLGLELELHEQIRQLTLDLLAAMNNPDTFGKLWVQFSEFGWQEVQKRKHNPREDYLTVLAQADFDGREMMQEEVGACFISLITAGHGTTVAALTNLLYEVFRNPDIRQRLIDDPTLIPKAVEESLRLRHPFLGLYREAKQDVELHGKTIKKGDAVLMCWEAANRDPSVTENPNEFDLDRPDFQHLGYGLGRHSCVGAPTARMEMRVVLEELLKRIPDLELVDPDKIEWEFHGAETQGFLSLPAKFAPKPKSA